ncbi:MAG: hypothetical protein Ct9H90mP25_3820 [Gammaproteobacteria bacterium]|nr:MAG: hypothetical protein Ct9H90mP25_3820 [Gammaproteobacteria bacterium]
MKIWGETPDVAVGEGKNSFPRVMQTGDSQLIFYHVATVSLLRFSVPSDWGDRELVWTLKVNGVEQKGVCDFERRLSGG